MAKVALSLDILYVANPSKDGVIGLGDVYIGQPDTDPEVEANRKTVTIIQENGNEVVINPNEQPLNTGAGGVLLYQGSAVAVFVDDEYSLKINDHLGSQIYYLPIQNKAVGVSLTGSKINNGSFESVSGTVPDGWTLEETGTGLIASDSDSANGLLSLAFTSIDALGAGRAVSSIFDVTTGEGLDLGYSLKSTGEQTRNTVEIEWLNVSGGIVSVNELADHNAGTSPIVWDTFDLRSPDAPANAVQARIVLKGMNTGGGAMTGTSWFDDIRINDHSVNLGNAITEDSVNTLNNKTINEGTYTGVQSGFVGDIQGNADTADLADVIVDQGALATLNSVGSAQINTGAVGSAEIADNTVTFATDLKATGFTGSYSIAVAGAQILPKGVYAIYAVRIDGENDIDQMVQYFVGGQWRTLIVGDSFTGGSGSMLAISDGVNCRLFNNNSFGIWNVNYTRLYD